MDCPYCGELLQPEIRVHNIEDHGLTVCHKCNRTLVFEPPHGTFGETTKTKVSANTINKLYKCKGG